MYYRCKHFKIEELVSRKVFQELGDRAWLIFDPNLLAVLDYLRDRYGPMYINNWLWGGNAQLRGLRHPRIDYAKLAMQGIYKDASLHNFAKASDIHFKYPTTKEVREYILWHPTEFPHIKGVEIASWLHIDTRNSEKVVVFNAN